MQTFHININHFQNLHTQKKEIRRCYKQIEMQKTQ
jgi:hypothetical protein